MKLLSTTEAARKLGVTRLTIQRRIAAGTITPPKLRIVGKVKVRLWASKDITRVAREMRERKRRKEAQ